MCEYTEVGNMSSSQRAVRGHRDRMKNHLEKALDEEDGLEKNYHIQSALQYLVMIEDDAQRREKFR